MSQSPVIMRAGSTLAVSNTWTNLIDRCKPILARRRPDGAARRFHLDSRGYRVVLLLGGPEQHAQVNPRVHSLLQDCAHIAASHFVISGARCCVDGVPTHRRQDAVSALCPKSTPFTPDSGSNGIHHAARSWAVRERSPKASLTESSRLETGSELPGVVSSAR
jgi:hypothetical protein